MRNFLKVLCNIAGFIINLYNITLQNAVILETLMTVALLIKKFHPSMVQNETEGFKQTLFIKAFYVTLSYLGGLHKLIPHSFKTYFNNISPLAVGNLFTYLKLKFLTHFSLPRRCLMLHKSPSLISSYQKHSPFLTIGRYKDSSPHYRTV
jgi:hypothetical protein